MSSVSSSYNNGGRDRTIGFRMSSDEIRSRSDDRNQCNMQKKDRNFLRYENRSIMNTKTVSYNWRLVQAVGCEPNLTSFLDPHYGLSSYDGMDSRFIWIPPSASAKHIQLHGFCARISFLLSGDLPI